MEKLVGSASLRRIGLLRFPTLEFLSHDQPEGETVLATMGRGGWFKIYFGRGRRMQLADGTDLRLIGFESAGAIAPIITSAGGKVATSSPTGYRSYGINGRDFAYNLYRDDEPGPGRSTTWSLVEFDTHIATLGTKSMYADHPVPVPAALLSLMLIKYGIPGESKLGLSTLRW